MRLDRELAAGEPQRLLGERLGHAGELEHHAAGLDDGDPALGRALAGAHARLGRLLRERLVREDVDPDLAATLDLAGHGDTGGLDLPVRDPAGLERLQAEVAVLDGELALGRAATAPAVVLAECGSAREQHYSVVSSSVVSGAAVGRGCLGSRRCLGLRRRLVGRRLGVCSTARPARRVSGARPRGRPPPRPGRRRRTGPRPSRSGPRRPSRWPRPSVGAARAAAAARLILVAEPQLAPAGQALEALGHDLALVDPDLDADAAEGRLRLGEAVVDVGADRVQRDAALRVALGAAHLGAAEAAAALHLDAVGAGAHRRGERALHRAPEADAVLELLRDRLGDELRVELGPLDLVDVDLDVLVRHGVDLAAQRVDLDARLADDDARPGRVDVDGDPLLVLADQDVRQARVGELAVDVLADPDVLEQRAGEVLVRHVPVRLPVVDDADAHPAGMDFLAH